MYFNDFWNNLTKVADIAKTFLSIDSGPEMFNATDEFLLTLWFDFASYELFKLVPHIFYGVTVR